MNNFYTRWRLPLYSGFKSAGRIWVVFAALVFVASCDRDSPNVAAMLSPGEIDGTGVQQGSLIYGKALEGAPISGGTLQVTSSAGELASTKTKSNGDFAVSYSNKADAYLLRVEQSAGVYLYAIAHQDDGVGEGDNAPELSVNVHALSDLVARLWFSMQSAKIDEVFSVGLVSASFPSLSQLQELKTRVTEQLALAVKEHNVPVDFDYYTEDIIDRHGFEAFLRSLTLNVDDLAVSIYARDPADPEISPIVLADQVPLAQFGKSAAPPKSASNFRVMMVGQTSSSLVWQEGRDAFGLVGYEIYRNNELIGETAFNRFVDTQVLAGQAYEYSVVTVNGGGVKSDAVVEDYFAGTMRDEFPPMMPAAMVIYTGAAGEKRVTWPAREFDESEYFEVRRSDRSDSLGEVVGKTRSNEFVDYLAPEGIDLCYSVIAVDAAKNRSLPSVPSCYKHSENTPINPSVIEFKRSQLTINERQQSIDIYVVRTGDASQEASIDYFTESDSAVAGLDFKEHSGSLIWRRGDATAKRIGISVFLDQAIDRDEAFFVRLEKPVNTLVGSRRELKVNIEDSADWHCFKCR